MTRRLAGAAAAVLLLAATAYLGLHRPAPVSPVSSSAWSAQEGRPHVRSSFSIYNRDDALSRMDYELRRLRDPATGRIPDDIRRRELAFAAALPQRAGKKAATWTLRGPDNVGGRTRALAVDRRFDGIANRVVLAGGVSGGMYRSEDDGQTWALTTDPADLASVTALAQDPTAPDVWYYGTGEGLGNSASGGGSFFVGDGLFKSTDGGRTWTSLPSTRSNSAPGFDSAFDLVWNVAVDGRGTVFAAICGQIVYSTDDGQSWFSGLEAGCTGSRDATDVAVAADGTVYASAARAGSGRADYGVYRSDDGGATWRNINPPQLAADPYRIVLGPAPSDAATLYVLAQTAAGGSSAAEHQLLRYDAATEQWTDLSAGIPNASGVDCNASFCSQGGYDLIVEVKPTNPNVVYIGGTNLYRSADGGQSFTRVGGYAVPENYSQFQNHHSDQHALVFYPNDPDRLISGHDGGLSRGTDGPAIAWTSLNNGYVTSQYYALSIDPVAGGDVVVGGLQDNGTWLTESADGRTPWVDVFSGDGGFTAVAPGGQTLYVSSQLGNLWRIRSDGQQASYANVSPQTGGNYLFITPFLLDPNDARVMYVAEGGAVWRNSDLDGIPDGNFDPTPTNWSRLDASAVADNQQVTALAKTTVPAGRLYFGATNYQSNTTLVRVDDPAADGAGIDITPPVAQGAYPSSIAVNPRDGDELLATFSNYGVTSAFHSTDGGQSWAEVEGNLGGADGPSVRWAAIVPSGDGATYFLAASTGLYAAETLAGGATTWLQEGAEAIGNVVVNTLAVRSADGLVVAGTHGRGVYSATVEAGAAAVAAASVTRLDLAVRPGEAVEQTFELRNTGAATLTYSATAAEPVPAGPETQGAPPPAIGTAVPLAPGARADLGARAAAQATLFSDSFEGAFPGSTWLAGANDGYADAFFGTTIRRASDGPTSIYASASGSAGGEPPYPAGMNAFMTTAPFDLTGVTAGTFAFDAWVQGEADFLGGDPYDYLFVGADPDGDGFYGGGWVVETDGWETLVLDLAAWPGVGDLRGQPEVRFGFFFVSDASVENEGAYVDDVLLSVDGGVENQAPTAVAVVAPAQAGAGEAITFDGSGSSDPDGTVTGYAWTFGDGGTSAQAVATHAYQAPGTYTYTLTVTDDDGATDQAAGTVTVTATEAPRLTVAPASGTLLPGAAQTVTVRYDAMDLAAGTYDGEIVIGGNGGTIVLPVRVVVAQNVARAPAAELPTEVRLEANYPNPFNPETVVPFVLPAPAQVTLSVYDVQGRRVRVLVSGPHGAGRHTARWDGRDAQGTPVASGVYVYRLDVRADGAAPSRPLAGTMILLK